MEIITKEIERKLPHFYATEEEDKQGERSVIVKFFTPWSNWTWYVFEGEKQENGDWLFYGLVSGHEKEFGYFTLSQLTEINGPFGLKIERDMYLGKKTLQDLEPEFCHNFWSEV